MPGLRQQGLDRAWPLASVPVLPPAVVWLRPVPGVVRMLWLFRVLCRPVHEGERRHLTCGTGLSDCAALLPPEKASRTRLSRSQKRGGLSKGKAPLKKCRTGQRRVSGEKLQKPPGFPLTGSWGLLFHLAAGQPVNRPVRVPARPGGLGAEESPGGPDNDDQQEDDEEHSFDAHGINPTCRRRRPTR